MTKLEPKLNSDAEGHYKLAESYLAQGKLVEAVTACQAAIALQANFAAAYITLGKAQLGQGQLDAAASAYAKAIESQPDCSEAYADLGTIALQSGQVDKAMSLYYKATDLQPDLAIAHWMLANLLNQQGNQEEGFSHQQKALEIKPDLISSNEHNSMGSKLFQQGNLEEAIVCFQRAILLKSNFAMAYLNLGNALLQQEQPEAAISNYQKVIAIEPNNAEAYFFLGKAFGALDKSEEALAFFQQAIDRKPNYAEAYVGIAHSLAEQEKVEEAVAYCQKALEIQPDYAEAYCKLVDALNILKNYKVARQTVDRYVQFCEKTDPIRSAVAFVVAYVFSGLKHVGVTSKLLELESRIYKSEGKLSKSEIIVLYQHLLFVLHDLRDSPAENSRLSKLIGNTYREQIVKSKQRTLATARSVNQRNQGESLRIGFLSPHFRRHSVGWCSGDVVGELSHLTPYLYLYATDRIKADDRTQMFERAARKFYHPPSNAIKSADIAEQVLQDRIDVLVDLDSLTCPIHGEIFDLQPAPVCISWLGFDAPFLSTKNFFLGDWHTHPSGSEQYYMERLVRLPNAHMATEGFDRPTVNRDILRSSAGIRTEQVAYLVTSPSRKFTANAATAHVQILKHVPDSVLLHKGFGDTEVVRVAYQMECDLQKVEFSRIKFLPRSDTEEMHRTIYELADVSLDSYPYNGGTHNLETLWFNLPIVTRTGEQSFSRMGYSFLKTLGIEAGIAWSWEEYVEWGIQFGLDADLRNSVRDRLVKSKQTENLSPLWNPKQLARDMYTIFEELLLKPSVNGNS